MADHAEPWERQPGETAPGFAAFCTYRDLGPRRGLRPAGRAHYGDQYGSGKLRQVESWSSRFDWPARAAAWDAHKDAVARDAELEEVKAMRRRHAQLAVTMSNRVLLRLVGGQMPTAGGPVDVIALDPNKLSPVALARLAEAAVKIERSARGEPDTIVAPGTASGEGSAGPEQDVARQLLANPELAQMAADLATRLSDATAPAGVE